MEKTHDLISELFDSYQRIRKTPLTFSQFINILNLYPSILVCMSDGVLDEEEWQGFFNVAHDLALYSDEGQEDGELQNIYLDEFRYLLENTEAWQEKFMKALRAYVSSPDGNKEFVLESMYLFANASNGISSVEMAKIKALSEELSLNA